MNTFNREPWVQPPLKGGKLLHCSVCNTKVEVEVEEAFNYTADGDGPFCYTCWFFVQHIEALRDRVTDLEKKAELDRIHRHPESFNRQSPYDCSRRRTPRGGPR
jgi:hypothetical protein